MNADKNEQSNIFRHKYLKYKNKYLELRKIYSGGKFPEVNINDFINIQKFFFKEQSFLKDLGDALPQSAIDLFTKIDNKTFKQQFDTYMLNSLDGYQRELFDGFLKMDIREINDILNFFINSFSKIEEIKEPLHIKSGGAPPNTDGTDGTDSTDNKELYSMGRRINILKSLINNISNTNNEILFSVYDTDAAIFVALIKTFLVFPINFISDIARSYANAIKYEKYPLINVIKTIFGFFMYAIFASIMMKIIYIRMLPQTHLFYTRLQYLVDPQKYITNEDITSTVSNLFMTVVLPIMINYFENVIPTLPQLTLGAAAAKSANPANQDLINIKGAIFPVFEISTHFFRNIRKLYNTQDARSYFTNPEKFFSDYPNTAILKLRKIGEKQFMGSLKLLRKDYLQILASITRTYLKTLEEDENTRYVSTMISKFE